VIRKKYKKKRFDRKYRQEHYEDIRRNNAKRKGLGFIALNKKLSGTVGHHIDKERVIFMPLKIHKRVRHSVLENKNMDTINRLAYEFLEWCKQRGADASLLALLGLGKGRIRHKRSKHA
jgi:hypothetical protein